MPGVPGAGWRVGRATHQAGEGQVDEPEPPRHEMRLVEELQQIVQPLLGAATETLNARPARHTYPPLARLGSQQRIAPVPIHDVTREVQRYVVVDRPADGHHSP
jgi:hypothetical protein